MIVAQQIVAVNTRYSIDPPSALTIFDFHNNSPFNLGVSFGVDTGMANAQYFASPQSVLYGISAIEATKYSVGGSRFGGNIFLYTQAPPGGSTIYANAPSNCVTVIGYVQGQQPQNVSSLGGLVNLGNSLPLSTSSTGFQNDGNPAGTLIGEATVSGDANGSAVQLQNTGILILGNRTYGGQLTAHQIFCLNSGVQNLMIAVEDGDGNLHLYNVNGATKITNSGHTAVVLTIDDLGDILFSGMLGIASNGDLIDAATIPGRTYIKASSEIILQVPNGTNVARIDSSGNLIIKGVLTQHGSP